MNDQRDNPYAAPSTPPEAGPPISRSVFVRALVRGAWAGVVTFVLAAGVATLTWIMCTTWFGSPVAEREDLARTGLLACCIVVSILLGLVATERDLRRRM
jgi:hypothetical protein